MKGNIFRKIGLRERGEGMCCLLFLKCEYACLTLLMDLGQLPFWNTEEDSHGSGVNINL